MKNKIIFELNISNDLKLFAFEDKNYDELFDGSHLCIKYSDTREMEMVQGSFAYEFGMEMYIRLFNINEYKGNNIARYMEDQLNNYSENLYDYDKYIFVNCANDYTLLLYRDKDYHFVLIKYNRNNITKVYKAEIIFDMLIKEDQLHSWINIIYREFATRAREEAENAFNLKYDDIEWLRYLESLKDEKKDYKNDSIGK